MNGSVFDEKSVLKIMGLSFFSKLDWGTCIVSTAKPVTKKIGSFFHSIEFLSFEIVIYLYESTIQGCMEYCCRVWAVTSNCYFYMLDKIEKWTRRTVAPTIVNSLEALAYRRYAASV